MPRIFTTQREISFFNDLSKELLKDVVGQKIYYYPISVSKTPVHDVYEESPDKVFEDPIEIEGLVNWMPREVSTNHVGIEYKSKIEVFLQSRDLIDKEIEAKEGDFFTFGPKIYEITSVIPESIIHGQVEHEMGIKLMGIESRKSQFVTKVFGPTKEKFSDDDAVQDTFVQQRGQPENRLGPTEDKRDLIEDGVLEGPVNGPAEVSEQGQFVVTGSNSSKSSFYGDDC
jgi:hypothetical protein